MFELIMQAAAATADPNITIVSTMIVTGAGAVTAIISFLKSKEAKDLAGLAGKVGLMGTQKATEAKAIALKLAPEEKQDLVRQIAEEVKTGMKQVNAMTEKRPEFDPQKLDVPREGFDTRPKPAEVQQKRDESNVLK